MKILFQLLGKLIWQVGTLFWQEGKLFLQVGIFFKWHKMSGWKSDFPSEQSAEGVEREKFSSPGLDTWPVGYHPTIQIGRRPKVGQGQVMIMMMMMWDIFLWQPQPYCLEGVLHCQIPSITFNPPSPHHHHPPHFRHGCHQNDWTKVVYIIFLFYLFPFFHLAS